MLLPISWQLPNNLAAYFKRTSFATFPLLISNTYNMQIINRSAITLKYKKPFIDWHNNLMPGVPYTENMSSESSTTYLIPDFKSNAAAVIKKYYKEIFETELFQMWTDENDWPPKITLKLFHEWFNVDISAWVYDLDKIFLKRSKF